MLLHGVDPLVPNILKEDGIDATKRKVKLKRRGKESAFADVSNHIVSELQPISSSQLAPTVMTQRIIAEDGKREFPEKHLAKKQNFILDFNDSSGSEETPKEEEQNFLHSNLNSTFHQNLSVQIQQGNADIKPKSDSDPTPCPKNTVVKRLFFDDQDSFNEQSDEQPENSNQQQVQANESLQSQYSERAQGPFGFDSESSRSQERQKTIKTPVDQVISLSQLIRLHQKANVYSVPIPKGHVMQFIVKRDKLATNGETLIIYDARTLRSFCRIEPDPEGFVIVAKFPQRRPGQGLERVVGKVLVSFFGTTFYGYSCEFPKREAREINPVLDPLLIELSYEANPLGLTGPRKMKMYIARDKPRPTKGSLLSNLYEKETKQKVLERTVLHYNNKPPEWCAQIKGYTLNFKGRATMASVKNFIFSSLVEQKGDKKGFNHNADDHLVVFGKIGKDAFNLDIKHPFSILHGLTMAMSSLKKKLLCE